MQVEAHLQSPRETLQIPYPQGTRDADKTHADDAEIIVGYEPRYYTEAEIAAIQAFIPKLTYSQSLILTGAVLVGDDALLSASHDDLDRIEVATGALGSRYIDDESERPVRDRVYLIRELGYRGDIIPAPEVAPEEPKATPATKTSEKASKKEAAA